MTQSYEESETNLSTK
jgi:hypothetical protein